MSKPGTTLWAHVPPCSAAFTPVWHPVDVGDQLNAGASGGTASIRKVLSASHATYVAKMFDATALAADKGVLLHTKISDLARFAGPLAKGHTSKAGHVVPARPFVAWPELVLYTTNEAKPEHFRGFLMPKVEGEMLTVLNSPRHRKQRFADYSPQRLFQVGAAIAEQLQNLHGLDRVGGILFGDLTPRNIMVGPDWRVTFIDADSYQYRGNRWCLPSSLSTPGFRSPRMAEASRAGKPLPEYAPYDDAYALAILLFHLLVDGAHPWRSADRFEVNGTSPDEEDNMLAGRFPYTRPDELCPPKIRFATYQKLPADIRKAFELTFAGDRTLCPGAWAVLLRRAAAGDAKPLQLSSLHPELRTSLSLLPA